MSSARLVTGATGFVGGAIVLELIRETPEPIICVVRPGRDGGSPRDRLRASLETACREYDEPDLLESALQRCTAVAGDLALPECGVDAAVLPEIGEVWHAAASLAFEDEREEAIAAANVDGTEGVLTLARSLRAPVFNHVSTAYVGGARDGLRRELIPAADAPSNNAYERTKLIAERIVDAADLPRVRILRPGIVIGHSRTKAATAFTGLYGFIRNLQLLRVEVSRVLGDLLLHRPLRLIADGTAQINLMPIDLVARSAVKVGLSDTTARVFHLTNSAAPELGEGLAEIAKMVGIAPPRYVESRDELTAIDKQVDQKLRFYRSYISKQVEFDRANADAVLGPGSGRFPIDLDLLRGFTGWYLERLASEEFGRPAGGVLA